MANTAERRGALRAFTLVDLIVAIAITAALAALFFPVFAQARAREKSGYCLVGAKQARRSVELYADDYDDVNSRTAGALLPYFVRGDYSCPRLDPNRPRGFMHPPKYFWTQAHFKTRTGGPGVHALFNPGELLQNSNNGPVLTTTATAAIFWGTNWSNNTFAGDVITGLTSFYQGFGGSGMARAVDEYYGSNGRVTPNVTWMGVIMDSSAATSTDPTVADVNTEVCKNVPSPVPNGYYAVYTDTPITGVGYCAWHSFGFCGGTPIEFGWFPYQVGQGCDIGDTFTGHSAALASFVDGSAHELNETRSDPQLNAWLDPNGWENGDKCAWTYGGTPVTPSGVVQARPTLVTLSNGTHWMIQGMWSNAAYRTGQGYAGWNPLPSNPVPGLDGAHGCLAGTSHTVF